MPNRIQNTSDKKLPDLNFKLKFFINFSISSNKKLSIDFTRYCGNDDETRSQKLRDIVFEKLGVEDQKEFDKLFIDESNYVKDKIKDKIKLKNKYTGNKWFSAMVRQEIEKELENEK